MILTIYILSNILLYSIDSLIPKEYRLIFRSKRLGGFLHKYNMDEIKYLQLQNIFNAFYIKTYVIKCYEHTLALHYTAG
jgi:hypothetical protein